MLVGINDLQRALLPTTPEPITPARYETTYRELLARTVKRLPRCRIVLLEPFLVSTDRSETSFRAQVLNLLPEYLASVGRLSAEFGTRLVRTHGIFQELLRFHDPDHLSPEGVHLYPAGHVVLAEHVYRALSE